MSTTRLTALRTDRRRRALVTLAAVLLGLALAQVHWLGLVVGGALVAVPQRSLVRGLFAGLGFGLLAWLALLVTLWTTGNIGLYAAMGQIALLAAAIPLGLGLFGGLVRALG